MPGERRIDHAAVGLERMFRKPGRAVRTMNVAAVVRLPGRKGLTLS